MTRKILFGLLILVMILGLTGCTNAEIKIYDKDENTLESIVSVDNLTNEVNDNSSINNLTNEVNANSNIDNLANEVNSVQKDKNEYANDYVISVSSNKIYLEESNILVVSGYNSNGDVVWTYKTNPVPSTEFELANLIIDDYCESGAVYISELNTIKALDRQTGKVIWENADFYSFVSLGTISYGKLAVVGGETLNVGIIDIENGKLIEQISLPGVVEAEGIGWDDSNNLSVMFNCIYEDEAYGKFGIPKDDLMFHFAINIDFNKRVFYITSYELNEEYIECSIEDVNLIKF